MSEHDEKDQSPRFSPEVAEEIAFRAAPIDPPSELRDHLLDRARRDAGAERIQVFKSWKPAAEKGRGLAIVRAGEGEWVDSSPGVRFKQLAVDEERRYVTMLVRMDPGTSYPCHRHGGAEECYVIEGDLSVAGEELGPGDYQLAPAGSDHEVQSTKGGCLLLIVSSQDDELI